MQIDDKNPIYMPWKYLVELSENFVSFMYF